MMIYVQTHDIITWDVVVGGWGLEYCSKFVPDAVTSLTVVVDKPRKMKAKELALHGTYTAEEAGKLVLSINNSSSRKTKIVAYRTKIINS